MAKFVAVSTQMHAQKMWRRPADVSFAAKDPLTPVVLAEIGLVGSGMPIAFVEQAGRFVPMAVMGLIPEHNLFVGPEGQWLGGYVPAATRSYPSGYLDRRVRNKSSLCVEKTAAGRRF